MTTDGEGGRPSGEDREQVTALLAAQTRELAALGAAVAAVEGDVGGLLAEAARLVDRVAAAERRVARLDAHGGELARQALDLIIRVDALEEHLTERLRGLEARQRDLEGALRTHLGDAGSPGR